MFNSTANIQEFTYSYHYSAHELPTLLLKCTDACTEINDPVIFFIHTMFSLMKGFLSFTILVFYGLHDPPVFPRCLKLIKRKSWDVKTLEEVLEIFLRQKRSETIGTLTMQVNCTIKCLTTHDKFVIFLRVISSRDHFHLA